MARKFDRGVEDVGNILALEHLNLTVPDQATAALFYVSGLGFTRDPYVDFGVFNFNNMWVNVGDQQFHLPQGKAQRLPRHDRLDGAGSRQAALAARPGRQIVVGTQFSAGKSTTTTSGHVSVGQSVALPRAG